MLLIQTVVKSSTGLAEALEQALALAKQTGLAVQVHLYASNYIVLPTSTNEDLRYAEQRFRDAYSSLDFNTPKE